MRDTQRIKPLTKNRQKAGEKTLPHIIQGQRCLALWVFDYNMYLIMNISWHYEQLS